jgi:hypothetical protein
MPREEDRSTASGCFLAAMILLVGIAIGYWLPRPGVSSAPQSQARTQQPVQKDTHGGSRGPWTSSGPDRQAAIPESSASSDSPIQTPKDSSSRPPNSTAPMPPAAADGASKTFLSFQTAFEAGASCEQLFKIRHDDPKDPNRDRMNDMLGGVGCFSPEDHRTMPIRSEHHS